MSVQSSSMRFQTPILIFVYLTVPIVSAIRVDWNTNHGPIVPPTSTVAPVPQPPFREPAPVWEEPNDVPNPNPYQYVPPPPSRPRYNNPDNQQQQPPNYYNSASSSSSTSTSSTTTTPKPIQYGTIVRPNQVQNVDQTKTVASLSVKYIPNVGKKYFAVVPSDSPITNSWNSPKSTYIDANDVYDKFSGKYNAKLKKYKAYEQKAKMVPYVMYYQPKQQQYVYYNQFPTKSQPVKRFDQWSYNRV